MVGKMKALLVAALIAPLGACATITRGSSEAFVVETEPSGASVQTSNGLSCNATPCTFPNVKRDSSFSVTVSKPGYETSTHNVTHQMAGAGGAGMAGNLLLGGIIGAAVDANSGATRELVPNPLRIVMSPIVAPAPPAPVVAIEAPPPDAVAAPANPLAAPAPPAAQPSAPAAKSPTAPTPATP